MKQTIKKFNNLVKKTIFKVENKTNNNFNVSSFSKYLITFICLLFLYIFYLLLPLLYDKAWVQTNIEGKLRNEFKINLSNSFNISYRILPAPHFLIKDTKILSNNSKKQESVADVKNLQIFLEQKNFFNKEKMNIKNIIINNANFSFLRSNFKMLNDSSNQKFSKKKIKINKSNIFLKDNKNEIITIVKIDRANIFFDDKKLLNFFDLKGSVFTIPFYFELNGKNELTQKEIDFRAKSLNLNIFNETIKQKNEIISGRSVIKLLNSTVNTEYSIDDKIITFESKSSRINNSKVNYNGVLSINPFDLDLNINLNNHKISKLFNFNSVFLELLKSKLFFNDNISLNTLINISTDTKKEIFQDAKIYLNILNGKINFNKSRFTNNKIGSLELNNSNLFLENNKLILNADLFFDIKDSSRLFSFLNTNKKSRKEIRNILINLNYDFSSNRIKFNNIKIDNSKLSDKFLNLIEDFNNNDSNNLIKSRRLLNELFNIYEG